MKKNRCDLLKKIFLTIFILFLVISGFTIGNNFAGLSFDYKNNIFNIKNNKVPTIASENIKIIPSGQSIGVKLYTDGILVVGYSDIQTKSGKKLSPAAEAGIQVGDSLIEANDIKIGSNKQLYSIINENKNKEIKFKIKRNDEDIYVKLSPIYADNDEAYKIGLWIRDSTAGVGTLTFYIPDSQKFGALGHPINDSDTNTLLKIKDGSVYSSKIISIEQGTKGKPGELRGIFSQSDEFGKIDKNTNEGIYGKIINNDKIGSVKGAMGVAKQSEIKEGPAKILTSIDDGNIKEYDIEIEKINYQTKPGSKSMVIRVTDKELLEKTGGIVQGMSGSPIIQNDKVVGAVTHVFVNRPDMGYAIYIEWMLMQMGICI
ncbi:MAG TPA: SpoIVB peptidase [Clostridiaceae bacterium]|nr:SpoIVB peptidase [Clostridiaceae bacterium]HBN28743.1 SpoIVB peptidase [Clostridiaceae bacterium]